MTEFCPRCGTARTGSFRFCRSCQFDFEEGQPGGAPARTQSRAQVQARENTPAKVAGIAWLVASAITAYVGIQAIGVAESLSRLVGTSDLRMTGNLNIIGALVNLPFGIVLLRHPGRTDLAVSAIWAVLSILAIWYSLSTGAVGWAAIVVIAYVVAFVGSLLGRDSSYHPRD